ncbi:hypothetical protein BYT27DRAFT_7209266 [Phlegmacium glaucopus]|nr:hypothetical protein BYT27DRAFT_7209266 [Phlegmacium glaucopus]
MFPSHPGVVYMFQPYTELPHWDRQPLDMDHIMIIVFSRYEKKFICTVHVAGAKSIEIILDKIAKEMAESGPPANINQIAVQVARGAKRIIEQQPTINDLNIVRQVLPRIAVTIVARRKVVCNVVLTGIDDPPMIRQRIIEALFVEASSRHYHVGEYLCNEASDIHFLSWSFKSQVEALTNTLGFHGSGFQGPGEFDDFFDLIQEKSASKGFLKLFVVLEKTSQSSSPPRDREAQCRQPAASAYAETMRMELEEPHRHEALARRSNNRNNRRHQDETKGATATSRQKGPTCDGTRRYHLLPPGPLLVVEPHKQTRHYLFTV